MEKIENYKDILKKPIIQEVILDFIGENRFFSNDIIIFSNKNNKFDKDKFLNFIYWLYDGISKKGTFNIPKEDNITEYEKSIFYSNLQYFIETEKNKYNKAISNDNIKQIREDMKKFLSSETSKIKNNISKSLLELLSN